ncbi:hypothetical protein [Dactylosporangium sp. NPDC005555]|uniref:sacsin N-terminal ATP-binding-like domain-containing protein n=1 Tax=Dactylosporangium sp. NPDC005555 TaxID=3154889 RepID=UPI0033BE82EE
MNCQELTGSDPSAIHRCPEPARSAESGTVAPVFQATPEWGMQVWHTAGMQHGADASDEYRRRILYQADGVAQMFLRGREVGQPMAREHKEIIEGIVASDYDGRTLIELLQNGHDAHPADRSDGQLEFLLHEEEGRWGVLYVANGGDPISHDDFPAMCRIAMSSKRPDEGIGNKGVGFKSVLQLAGSPEVYSRADASSAGFDGYCFRFARPADFDGLAERVAPDRPGLGDDLRENVASLQVPIPLDDLPDEVQSYQAKGFATVVRLVLRSEQARGRARKQLKELTAPEVPLHLFLDRVGELTVRWTRSDRAAKPVNLRRKVSRLFSTDDLVIDEVLLQDAKRFMMLRLRVPESDMRAAIADGRKDGLMSANWEQWKGDGQVCVALPMDDVLAKGRLYTFLPMGGGRARAVVRLRQRPVLCPARPAHAGRDDSAELPVAGPCRRVVRAGRGFGRYRAGRPAGRVGRGSAHLAAESIAQAGTCLRTAAGGSVHPALRSSVGALTPHDDNHRPALGEPRNPVHGGDGRCVRRRAPH